MPIFTVTLSSDAAQWIVAHANHAGSSPESAIAELVEEAASRSKISWEEGAALKCFTAMRAGPGVLVPVKSLWIHWSRIAPGATNQAFRDAIDGLVAKKLVVANQDQTSFSLTASGHTAAVSA
jgi:hypothetical protein